MHVLQFALDQYSGALLNYVSTALRRVCLSTKNSTQPTPVVGTFLRELIGRTPHLKDLFIRARLSPSTVTVIPQLPVLQSLTLVGLGPCSNLALLRQLSTLNYMNKLHFSIEEPLLFPSSVATIPAIKGFSALEELTLHGTFPDITDALTALRDNRIKSLHIEVIPDVQIEPDVFQRICHACLTQVGLHFRSLKALKVTYYNSPRIPMFDPFDIIEVFMWVLHPVLELGQIEVVDLVGFPPCNLSDDDIETIASAWPLAKSISLPSATVLGRFGSFPSMIALSSFAKRCPNLQTLSMAIDGRITVPSADILSHRLETLSLTESWIDNTMNAAPYIDRIFPFTKSFQYSRKGEDHIVWSQVAQWIPILQAVRADQDNRRGASALVTTNTHSGALLI